MNNEKQSHLTEFDAAFAAEMEAADLENIVPADEVLWVLHAHINENGTAQRLPVQCQPFTIGRHPENTVSISNGTVSGHHAEILIAGDQLLIRDRDSTNGTLLNGRRLYTVEALRDNDILHFGNVMFTVQKDSAVTQIRTVASDAASEAIAQVQFSTLMSRPGVEPYFQPIVRLGSEQRIGFEVLSRSQFIGLETPAKMFKVAAQRTSEAALSRICRLEGMRATNVLDPSMDFYLNTHPAELNDQDLIYSLRDLRQRYPDLSIMLEVHESGVTSVDYLRCLRQELNDLSIGLAYDDFGAGQARLTELIEVPPDVLKFDVKLVQGLSTATDARRSTVAGLIRIVKDLDVIPLAEGIETREEAEICQELGFELAQGYLFGKGEPVKKWVPQAKTTPEKLAL